MRATFSFYNMGGAAATGLRVRFALPDGLRYLVGSARIDETPLDEPRGECALLSSAGAELGEIPAGVERRISLAYSVAPTIENGAVFELQAALASEEIPLIGSNVVRLVARSRPDLQNPKTLIELEALREPVPGEEIRIAAHVHNSGQSSARDVVVVLPVPDRTSFVPGSARIDGREVLDNGRDDPFGFAHAPIAVPALPPGATLVVDYRVRIDAPLENGTRIYAHGDVACAEIPEFTLARSELVVRSNSRFDDEATRLVVESDADVEPGERLPIRLVARNVGTSAASGLRLRITLPEGLQYAPGSRTVDGRSVVEAGEPTLFVFERVGADQQVEAGLDAYVVSPALDGTKLVVVAQVYAPSGTLTFEHPLTVRARPRFMPGRNGVELLDAATVSPASNVRFVIRVANDGTTNATDARLRVSTDTGLEDLRFEEGQRGASRLNNGVIDLGVVEPGTAREIVVQARVASPIPDGTELRLSAVLETAEVPSTSLGTQAFVVRSRPRFTRATSYLKLASDEPLHPDRSLDVVVRVENEGTDIAHDVRIALSVSPEARLEAVSGATREGDALIFGNVGPGASVEATTRVRLAKFVAHGTTLAVEGRLTGVGFLPFTLDPIAIATAAEPEFRRGASLRTHPQDGIDAGMPVLYMLTVRNTGDGASRKLTVTVDPIANATYVPGSTSINDVALLDANGESPLWAGEGLVLQDVDPGTEIRMHWYVVVNTPLPAGTLIDAVARLAWDAGKELTVHGTHLRVRSSPAFAVRDSGLPFSVAAATFRGPLVQPPAVPALAALPRAVPVVAEAYEPPEPRVVVESVVREASPAVAEPPSVEAVAAPPAASIAAPAPAPPSAAVAAPPAAAAAEAHAEEAGHAIPAEPVAPPPVPELPVTAEVAPAPAAAEAAVAEPAAAEPVVAEPVVAGPVVAGPALAEPVAAEPVAAEPAVVAEQRAVPEPIAFAPAVAAQDLPAPPTAEEPPATAPEPVPAAADATAEIPAIVLAEVESVAVIAAPLTEPPVPPIPAPTPIVVSGVFETYVKMDRDRLVRTLRFLDEADGGNLMTHLFVLRAFFPDGILGLEHSKVNVTLTAQRDALRGIVDRLFIKLRLARYTLTVKDIEDGETRRSLHDLLEQLAQVQPEPEEAAVATADFEMWASLSHAEVDTLRALLEPAPLGSVAPWAVRAHFIGVSAAGQPALSTALARYRALLIGALTNVGPLPVEEFHRVLLSNTDSELDDALHGVLGHMRDIAGLAVSANRV